MREARPPRTPPPPPTEDTRSLRTSIRKREEQSSADEHRMAPEPSCSGGKVLYVGPTLTTYMHIYPTSTSDDQSQLTWAERETNASCMSDASTTLRRLWIAFLFAIAKISLKVCTSEWRERGGERERTRERKREIRWCSAYRNLIAVRWATSSSAVRVNWRCG